MGSSSSKESKASSTPSSLRNVSGHGHHAPGQPSPAQPSPQDRQASLIFAQRYARGGRPDLPFLGLVRDNAQSNSDRPRETKPEREARKAERERQARLKERERSMREEHVDGGYLVTLGTYTGPEDFDKSIVRQLQVSRETAKHMSMELIAVQDRTPLGAILERSSQSFKLLDRGTAGGSSAWSSNSGTGRDTAGDDTHPISIFLNPKNIRR